MKLGRNPIILILLNFVVGAMVSQGIIEPNNHNTVVEYAAEIVGLVIILLTTIVSLMKVVKHKNPEEMAHEGSAMQTQMPTSPTILNQPSIQINPPLTFDNPTPAQTVDTGTPPLFTAPTSQTTATGTEQAVPPTVQ